jgi:hypothetical protein
MICIPKYSEIHGDVPIPATGIQGEYRIEKYDENGQLLYDTGWIKNLITDYGMAAMTDDAGFSAYFYTGSGTTPPQVTDTQMESFLAPSNVSQGSSEWNSVPVAPDYEKWNQQTKRFGAGVGTGVVSEVGIGGNTTSIGELFCRQLVTPPVNKSANQILDVTWRITKYPNLVDVNGTATLDGVLYDTVVRPLNVDNHQDAQGTFAAVRAYNATGVYRVGDEGLVPYTDSSLSGNTLGPGNGGTSGTSGYVGGGPDYGFRDMSIVWGLNYGNLANGIRTAVLASTGPQYGVQVQFTEDSTVDGTVPKDATKELVLNWQTRWVRR